MLNVSDSTSRGMIAGEKEPFSYLMAQLGAIFCGLHIAQGQRQEQQLVSRCVQTKIVMPCCH
jgi:hypothetical protein